MNSLLNERVEIIRFPVTEMLAEGIVEAAPETFQNSIVMGGTGS